MKLNLIAKERYKTTRHKWPGGKATTRNTEKIITFYFFENNTEKLWAWSAGMTLQGQCNV